MATPAFIKPHFSHPAWYKRAAELVNDRIRNGLNDSILPEPTDFDDDTDDDDDDLEIITCDCIGCKRARIDPHYIRFRRIPCQRRAVLLAADIIRKERLLQGKIATPTLTAQGRLEASSELKGVGDCLLSEVAGISLDHCAGLVPDTPAAGSGAQISNMGGDLNTERIRHQLDHDCGKCQIEIRQAQDPLGRAPMPKIFITAQSPEQFDVVPIAARPSPEEARQESEQVELQIRSRRGRDLPRKRRSMELTPVKLQRTARAHLTPASFAHTTRVRTGRKNALFQGSRRLTFTSCVGFARCAKFSSDSASYVQSMSRIRRWLSNWIRAARITAPSYTDRAISTFSQQTFWYA